MIIKIDKWRLTSDGFIWRVGLHRPEKMPDGTEYDESYLVTNHRSMRSALHDLIERDLQAADVETIEQLLARLEVLHDLITNQLKELKND